jgi:hypothetical protein
VRPACQDSEEAATDEANDLFQTLNCKPDGYLHGSYRIATAPEPNSSRLTSFKSTWGCEKFGPGSNGDPAGRHRPPQPGLQARRTRWWGPFDFCLHGRGGAAPSIDTAMHGLVTAADVDPLHADSGIAIATPRSRVPFVLDVCSLGLWSWFSE